MDTPNSAWSMVTPMLLFSCFCLLVGDILFGYDTGSFGGVLANPGFVNQFGTYSPETRKYSIDSLHTSLLTSLAFIGKFIGCLFAGPAIEMYGHRTVFFGLSIISVVGIIVEMTSAGNAAGTGRLAQFIAGRIVVYISVGLVEVNVTIYQSEIVPAFFRGFVVVSLQLFLTVGSILASVVNKVFSTSTDSVGWKTITGIQFAFPVLIIFFTFFIPTSPRWLLSKDRNEEAVISLRRLRPKVDTMNGNCEVEIQSIREALQQNVHKTSWPDLLRGTNLRRTMIVIVNYFFQQATGQAFVSTYSVVFYKTNGYAEYAFTYPLITACLGFLALLPAMYMVDKLGRRFSLMISFFFQTLWLFILAGIGEKGHKSTTEKDAVVAVFMLYAISYNMGGGPIPYLIGAEVPNAAVREKTQAIGTSWNVMWAFVTNFALPYMINGIHFKVGWVFGSIAFVGLLFTFFFLPETKGRSLEEIDAIYSVPFNPFRSIDSEGASRSHLIEGKPSNSPDSVGKEPWKGIAQSAP
ncbi:putative sugar transporter [Penicillium brasilianum]|uniref:Putative sugar transporter n=1 Tax=Penicillium brasilianum TaxID=104259 RepID=A0A1S9R9H0_PENBI|nr:putative sugar transporter [Penicillium brasilianum]